MRPVHYKGQLVYWRLYCGEVYEVFVNDISIGLSHIPLDYAQRTIDAKLKTEK